MFSRIALLPALVPLIACALFSPEVPVDARPDDFSLRYYWSEGSLPPPYHYAFTIALAADGAGTVTMTPDYPGPEVPVWTETFVLDAAALDAFYSQLVAAGAFSTDWREEDEPPVGGSHYTIELTANGEVVTIPHFVVAGQAAAQGDISDAIVAAVPQTVWDTLEAQRQAYVEENGG